jgi:magnesium transporter
MAGSMNQAPEAAPCPRIRTVACIGGISLERGVPPDEIHDHLIEPDNMIWMDVQDAGPAEMALLMEQFSFHPLALEDVAHGKQRPKVDEYKGYVFMVTYAILPGANFMESETIEVDLFIGRNYVVSLHRGRVPALEDALARWTGGGQMLREGVGFLVYTVLDAIIDAYFPVIRAIEDEVDDIELSMHAGLDPDSVQNLLALKRKLFSLRRILDPLRDAFHVFLKRDRPMFSAGTVVYFQDVYDHMLRILDVLEMEREMVTGALLAYQTILSNRLNATMRTLTVLTVVVSAAGLVFGAFGMNVPVPWTGHYLAFAGIVAVTSALIGMGLAFSWKRGWM